MSTQALEAPTVSKTDFAPITESDLIWWTDKISTLDWVFAVTYAESAPHEYICDRTEGMSHNDFERASRIIHTFGRPRNFSSGHASTSNTTGGSTGRWTTTIVKSP